MASSAISAAISGSNLGISSVTTTTEMTVDRTWADWAVFVAVMYDTNYVTSQAYDVTAAYSGGDVSGTFLYVNTQSDLTVEWWVLPREVLIPQGDSFGATAYLSFNPPHSFIFAFQVANVSPNTGPILDTLAGWSTVSPVSISATFSYNVGFKGTILAPTSDGIILMGAMMEEGTGATATITSGTELAQLSAGVSPTLHRAMVGYMLPPTGGADTISWTQSTGNEWIGAIIVPAPAMVGFTNTLAPQVARPY